jgi:hypothetical protein
MRIATVVLLGVIVLGGVGSLGIPEIAILSLLVVGIGYRWSRRNQR